MSNTTNPVDLSTFDRDWLLSNKSLVIRAKGSRLKDYVIVDLSRVYCPPGSDRNPTRKDGLDEQNIKDLEQSFLNQGVIWSHKPMCVRWNPQVIDGVSYDYELIAGNHRFEALENIGQKSWYFAVYELAVDGISYSKSRMFFQLIENNHDPRKSSTMADIINATSWLVGRGELAADEKSVKEFIDETCFNKAATSRGQIVAAVLQLNGISQSIVTYTTKGAANFIAKSTDYTNCGKLDKKRNKHGWTVKEGYEYEFIMSAVKKFAQTGKESYFVCHTKAPTETMTLEDKRQKMKDTFGTLEDSLITVVDFYNKKGRFPWEVEGFMAQDHDKEEKGVVKV
jgi:hypothetical protein